MVSFFWRRNAFSVEKSYTCRKVCGIFLPEKRSSTRCSYDSNCSIRIPASTPLNCTADVRDENRSCKKDPRCLSKQRRPRTRVVLFALNPHALTSRSTPHSNGSTKRSGVLLVILPSSHRSFHSRFRWKYSEWKISNEFSFLPENFSFFFFSFKIWHFLSFDFSKIRFAVRESHLIDFHKSLKDNDENTDGDIPGFYYSWFNCIIYFIDRIDLPRIIKVYFTALFFLILLFTWNEKINIYALVITYTSSQDKYFDLARKKKIALLFPHTL